METVVNTFHWADYLIFVLSLGIATGIGIFYTWRDKKNQTTSNLLLGDRKMGLVPVTMSLMATSVSGGMIMGVPSEVFFNGTMFLYIVSTNVLSLPFVIHFIIPVYHQLQITSAYEYLELRFNKVVRVLGCLLFQLQTILGMALILYAPALALNQVMGIELWISIVVIGLVCTFYTALGGLKAVMWTDAFQMIIIWIALLVLIIKSTIDVGGISYVFEKADDGGKLQFNNFNPSPIERHTFWTLFIGGFMLTLSGYIGSQSMVQRFISMKNVKGAQSALYIQLPTSIMMITALVYIGLVLFAKYGDQNPVPCIIDKSDQLLPYLVMDVLGKIYGLPGLFVSCIFSASLSTVSSGVNALALVLITDILKPLYKYIKQRDMDEAVATTLSKVAALFYGLLTIGLAFLAQYFGSLIVQVGLSISGMVGGPLLGLFTLGFFFPCTNSLGATVAVLCSLLFSSWLAIGSVVNMSDPAPTSCLSPGNTTILNNTLLSTTTMIFNLTSDISIGNTIEKSDLQTFYSISYLYYSPLAVIIAVIVGLLVSCVTGGTRQNPVDKRLLSPLYHSIASLSNIHTQDNIKGLKKTKQHKEYAKKNKIMFESE
ncbi:sodium-coupled monocarboxylate transporter 1-like [Mytilus galloprovincialis]|uniref:sodium-coupled monocarboxylate transporter 1-like n=1 Tax=Mytilus galloprovincialis TaxID=29158 RepID=UPI003F7BA3F1